VCVETKLNLMQCFSKLKKKLINFPQISDVRATRSQSFHCWSALCRPPNTFNMANYCQHIYKTRIPCSSSQAIFVTGVSYFCTILLLFFFTF
jgi:hypothetical protein